MHLYVLLLQFTSIDAQWMFQGAFTIATIYISKFSETSKYMHASRGFHDCTEPKGWLA